MNKYLQQDTPTTETLLFKTSYVRMIEPICTNIPKIYGFSYFREEGGRKGRARKKKKKKSRNPQFFKSKLCSIKMKALKVKRADTFLDMANHFRGGVGVPGDREGLAPRRLGKVRPGWGLRLAPAPGFPISPPHFFCGGWGQNEDSPLGAAQVT